MRKEFVSSADVVGKRDTIVGRAHFRFRMIQELRLHELMGTTPTLLKRKKRQFIKDFTYASSKGGATMADVEETLSQLEAYEKYFDSNKEKGDLFVKGENKDCISVMSMYYIEDLRVIQTIIVNQQQYAFEGLFVYTVNPAPVTIDRILCALTPVNHGTLFDPSEIRQIVHYANNIPEALVSLKKLMVEERNRVKKLGVEWLRDFAKNLDTGASVGAVSGGLPTLGKRR